MDPAVTVLFWGRRLTEHEAHGARFRMQNLMQGSRYFLRALHRKSIQVHPCSFIRQREVMDIITSSQGRVFFALIFLACVLVLFFFSFKRSFIDVLFAPHVFKTRY